MNLLNSRGVRTDGRAENSGSAGVPAGEFAPGGSTRRSGCRRSRCGSGSFFQRLALLAFTAPWLTSLAGAALGASPFDLLYVAPAPLPAPLAGLRVNLEPTNIFAQWRLARESEWRDSGTVLSGLTAGRYPVEFKPVTGYLEPLVAPLPVAGGITNEFSFTFSNSAAWKIGSLIVTLRPSLLATAVNVNARGQWRRQGEATWRDSGERIDGLPAGSCAIEFKTVSDPAWIAPSMATVAVGANRENFFAADYFLPNAFPADEPRTLDFDAEVQTGYGTAPPYAYCGQLQTDLGWGSGTVVHSRIVLTAAHLVFDDEALAFVPIGGVQWFFQRHAGVHEPPPLTPRLINLLGGYAAQRTRSFDVAALYFSESPGPGRGGYSGYVISKPGEEWLTNAPLATIIGHPVENVPANARGQMHATPVRAASWQRDGTNWVYATTNLKAHPGHDGGPVCVLFTNGTWYPAGIFLGGSNETVVRVIDDAVASLIGNTFGQGALARSTAGEPPRPPGDCPTCSLGIYGVLEVSLTPTNIGALGGGYRFRNVTNVVIYREPFNRFFVLGNVPWTLEFLPAPDTIAPATRTITTTAGQTNRTTGRYKQWGQLQAAGTNTFLITGSSGSVYRIDFKPALNTNAWTPVRTQTVGSAGVTLTNLVPGASNAFYRAVLLP